MRINQIIIENYSREHLIRELKSIRTSVNVMFSQILSDYYIVIRKDDFSEAFANMKRAQLGRKWLDEIYKPTIQPALLDLAKEVPNKTQEDHQNINWLKQSVLSRQSFYVTFPKITSLLYSIGDRLDIKELSDMSDEWTTAAENFQRTANKLINQYAGLSGPVGKWKKVTDPHRQSWERVKADPESTDKQAEVARQVVDQVLSRLPSKTADRLRSSLEGIPDSKKLARLKNELSKIGMKL